MTGNHCHHYFDSLTTVRGAECILGLWKRWRPLSRQSQAATAASTDTVIVELCWHRWQTLVKIYGGQACMSPSINSPTRRVTSLILFSSSPCRLLSFHTHCPPRDASPDPDPPRAGHLPDNPACQQRPNALVIPNLITTAASWALFRPFVAMVTGKNEQLSALKC